MGEGEFFQAILSNLAGVKRSVCDRTRHEGEGLIRLNSEYRKFKNIFAPFPPPPAPAGGHAPCPGTCGAPSALRPPRRSGPQPGVARSGPAARYGRGERLSGALGCRPRAGRLGKTMANGMANAQKGATPRRCAHIANETTRDGVGLAARGAPACSTPYAVCPMVFCTSQSLIESQLWLTENVRPVASGGHHGLSGHCSQRANPVACLSTGTRPTLLLCDTLLYIARCGCIARALLESRGTLRRCRLDQLPHPLRTEGQRRHGHAPGP